MGAQRTGNSAVFTRSVCSGHAATAGYDGQRFFSRSRGSRRKSASGIFRKRRRKGVCFLADFPKISYAAVLYQTLIGYSGIFPYVLEFDDRGASGAGRASFGSGSGRLGDSALPFSRKEGVAVSLYAADDYAFSDYDGVGLSGTGSIKAVGHSFGDYSSCLLCRLSGFFDGTV